MPKIRLGLFPLKYLLILNNIIMETIIVWLGIFALWELTKLLKKKFPSISIRVVVVLLSLLAWSIYYVIQQSHPEVIQEAIKFATGAFAASQAIWMVLDKLGEKYWDLSE